MIGTANDEEFLFGFCYVFVRVFLLSLPKAFTSSLVLDKVLQECHTIVH